MDYNLPGSFVHGIFPGKNTGVGCHVPLQRIFPIQGSNPRLLHWQVDSLPVSHQGSPGCVEASVNEAWSSEVTCCFGLGLVDMS